MPLNSNSRIKDVLATLRENIKTSLHPEVTSDESSSSDDDLGMPPSISTVREAEDDLLSDWDGLGAHDVPIQKETAVAADFESGYDSDKSDDEIPMQQGSTQPQPSPRPQVDEQPVISNPLSWSSDDDEIIVAPGDGEDTVDLDMDSESIHVEEEAPPPLMETESLRFDDDDFMEQPKNDTEESVIPSFNLRELRELAKLDITKAIDQLRTGYTELYRGLDLLQKYVDLNMEAVNKILKKHDKNIELGKRERFVHQHLAKLSFYKARILGIVKRETEVCLHPALQTDPAARVCGSFYQWPSYCRHEEAADTQRGSACHHDHL